MNHQWRFKRNYQFPNAVRKGGNEKVYWWVVNVVFNKPLYGVIRYVVGSDMAWIESETSFPDADIAEEWIKKKIQELE